jgi:membrane protease YdiL (CAAX protease family)
LYPAAPATLTAAVSAEMAGTGKPVRGWNWYFGDALIMFAAWIVFAFVAVAIVGTNETSWSLVVLQLLPWLGLAGVPCLLAWQLGNGPRIDLGLRWKWSDIGWGVLYGILSLIVASILGYITAQFAGDFSSAAGELGAGLASNKPLLIVFVLMIAIGAPIVEEIAFRGQVFNSIAKFKVWPIVTVLLSATCFALFHFEAVRILLLLGVGIVLGLARWHTGSLTTSIVAHMCNNLPGALFLLLS